MGQCPVVPPAFEDDAQGTLEGLVPAVVAGTELLPGSGSPRKSAGRSGEEVSGETSKLSLTFATVSPTVTDTVFLSAHEAEPADMWILSPQDVREARERQNLAVSMLAGEHIVIEVDEQPSKEQSSAKRSPGGDGEEESTTTVVEDDFGDEAKTDLTAVMSSAAYSGVTFTSKGELSVAVSDITHKIGNFDKYAPNEPNMLESAEQALERVLYSRRDSHFSVPNIGSISEEGHSSSFEEPPMLHNVSFNSGGDSSMIEVHREEPHINSASTPQKAGPLSALQRRFQSKHGSDSNEEEARNLKDRTRIEGAGTNRRSLRSVLFQRILCGNEACLGNNLQLSTDHVLHLSMKAPMLNFYRKHYLPMFAVQPRPQGGRSSSLSTPEDAVLRLMGGAAAATDGWFASGSGNNSPMPDPQHAVSDVCLAVDDTAFLDLVVTGSLGLIKRTPASPQRRRSPTAKRHQKDPDHYRVLMHRTTEEPFAICALKSPEGPPVVRIYVTKPRVSGQRAAATTMDVGLTNDQAQSRSLYAWAEFVTEGEFPLPVHYSIFMATGSDGKFECEASYRGTHVAVGSPEIMVVGRTGKEKEYKGCCLLSVSAEDEDSQEHSDGIMTLSISPGVDPAIFICMAAIIDETLENTMRKQCTSHAKKLWKKMKQQQGRRTRVSKEDESDRRKGLGVF